MLADLNGYGYDDGFTTVIEWIGLVLLFSIFAVIVFGWIKGRPGSLYDSYSSGMEALRRRLGRRQ